jgi:hypothetical protein
MAAGKFYKALLELQTKIHHHISFFSSVVERGIAEMQIILRSLFRSREGAVLLHFLSLYLITARSIYSYIHLAIIRTINMSKTLSTSINCSFFLLLFKSYSMRILLYARYKQADSNSRSTFRYRQLQRRIIDHVDN